MNHPHTKQNTKERSNKKSKSSKQRKGNKKSASPLIVRAESDNDASWEIDWIPTRRQIRIRSIPEQLELVRTHGCNGRTGSSFGRSLLTMNQNNNPYRIYHPWSVTHQCTRTSLSSAIAWYVCVYVVVVVVVV
jgi:hypothetical protein